MTSFFRIGLIAHIALVVLLSAGAYLGVFATHIDGLPHVDLLGHALFIGAIGFFLDGVLEHRPLYRGFGSLAATVVIVLAGIEEYAQRLSPRRSSDLADFIADVVGVFFFVWLSRRMSVRVRGFLWSPSATPTPPAM